MKETKELRLDSSTREAYMKQEAEQLAVGGGRRAELPDELWRWTSVEIAHGKHEREATS